ncbi:MAG: type II secretory pathway predicted ATPase ExeA [Zhongshania marina]|jgi:type II secretory pathway predicted ATPase ExeA
MKTAIRHQLWEERSKLPMTPLKLKKILAAMELNQKDLCAFLKLPNGTHPSAPTFGHAINRNIWPSRTPKAMLQTQVKAFLRNQGADEQDVLEALEIDDGMFMPRSNRQEAARQEHPIVPIEDEIQLPENEMLTQTAKKHFKLFRDPFKDDIQSEEDVFLSPDIRYIRECMLDVAKRPGMLAVVGESGAGKSTLCDDLIDRIRREDLEIVVIMPRTIDKGRLTAAAICEAIIQDISMERPARSIEAKSRQVERLLKDSGKGGLNHVLIIEEAHDLAITAIKYLKRFSEIKDGFRRLLSIILIGQPELKDKLNERINHGAREVIQRMDIAELPPLGENLQGYLGHKFQRVNRKVEDIFEVDAFDAINRCLIINRGRRDYTESLVYPLRVNNIAIRCMNEAVNLGYQKVNAEVVQEVFGAK